MGKPNWAQIERKALANELDVVGPDAPTLCGDWTAKDLAAHLVAREARPDAAAGIVIKPLSGWTARVEGEFAQRSYTDLVDSVRNGPPIYSMFKFPGADSMLNTTEYFVHLEDIRRAQPDWKRRDLDPMLSESLWGTVKTRGALFFRHSPVGVLCRRTDGRGGQYLAHPGDERVEITGPAAEILLYAFGRKTVAQVEVAGSADALERFADADLSV